MAYEYLDIINGERFTLLAPISTGLTVDVDGVERYFIRSGIGGLTDTEGGYVQQINEILRASQIVGSTALPLSNTSTGARKSIFVGESDRLANTVDSTTLDGIPMVSSMAAATNLVTPVLTDWTDSGNAVSSSPSANLYRITLSAGAGTVVDAFASASNNRTFSCEARVVSGTVPALSVATFRAATVAKGTAFDLTTLTSSFQDVTAKVTTADATDDFAFVLASGTCVIEIKLIRAVDLSAPAAAFQDGTAAAEAYAVDVLSCTPTWPAKGTIVQVAVPYGYSGAGNPVSMAAHFFITTNSYKCFIPGGITLLQDASYISIGGFVTDSTPSIISADWNGTVIGARLDQISRKTTADTGTPSGSLGIGNALNGTAPFHGSLVTIIVPWVLSDAEYETLRAYLADLFSSVTYQ